MHFLFYTYLLDDVHTFSAPDCENVCAPTSVRVRILIRTYTNAIFHNPTHLLQPLCQQQHNPLCTICRAMPTRACALTVARRSRSHVRAHSLSRAGHACWRACWSAARAAPAACQASPSKRCCCRRRRSCSQAGGCSREGSWGGIGGG